MAFFKKNWTTILLLAFIGTYIGTTIVTRKCATCVVIDAFKKKETARPTAWQTKLVNGTPISSTELTSKVKVIVYFATWCAPCREEIPQLIALRNAFPPDELSVLAVSMDPPGKKLDRFISKHNINYQVARNSDSLDQTYGPIKYLPTILIVDKDGETAHRHTGAVSEDVLEMQVRTLLMKDNKT